MCVGVGGGGSECMYMVQVGVCVECAKECMWFDNHKSV